jgi:hypothetical protein
MDVFQLNLTASTPRLLSSSSLFFSLSPSLIYLGRHIGCTIWNIELHEKLWEREKEIRVERERGSVKRDGKETERERDSCIPLDRAHCVERVKGIGYLS